MNPIHVVRDLLICHPCACLIANGEYGDTEVTEAHHSLMVDTCAREGINLRNVVPGGDETEGIQDFTCDTCGESGPSYRHPAAELSR